MAVVGAPEWVNWGAKVGALFISGQLKTFPAGSEQAAWQWVTS